MKIFKTISTINVCILLGFIIFMFTPTYQNYITKHDVELICVGKQCEPENMFFCTPSITFTQSEQLLLDCKKPNTDTIYSIQVDQNTYASINKNDVITLSVSDYELNGYNQSNKISGLSLLFAMIVSLTIVSNVWYLIMFENKTRINKCLAYLNFGCLLFIFICHVTMVH